MRTYLPALVIASSLCLQSCAELADLWQEMSPEKSVSNPSADTLKQMVTIEYDPYKNIAIIRTPNIYFSNYDQRWNFMLRTWAIGREFYRTKDMNMQIYFTLYFRDWQFLDSAFALGGRNLKMTQISRDVVSCGEYGCVFEEHIAINLKLRELKAIVADGKDFQIQVSGKYSDIPISVRHKFLKGFLDALEEETTELDAVEEKTKELDTLQKKTKEI